MAEILLLIICLISSSCSLILLTEAKNNDDINIIGFSTELIHRDSPISPLFDPNSSSRKNYQRRDAALRRRLLQSSNNRHIGRTNLEPDGGQYLMKMSYGTPALESFSIVDSGSGLSWIQCLPRTNFYRSVTPAFNPRDSTSFEHVTDCRLAAENNSDIDKPPVNRPCPYDITYWDQSYSRGDLARETIKVGSGGNTVTFHKFLFGCAHDNGGHNFPYKSAGLVGFGPEENSFLSQLRDHHGGKFSHCFAPSTSSTPGKISFGSDASISGHGVVSTPLIIGDHYYLITLEGVTVGTTRLNYSPPPAANNKSSTNMTRSVNGATMLIDTGAEVIVLPEGLHIQIDLLVQKHINLRPTTYLPFTLCYPLSSLRDSDIPKITFHFEGMNLELGAVNTFIVRENKRCLGILPDDNINIFGNTAMINFLVAYDLQHHRVSFKPTDCTRH